MSDAAAGGPDGAVSRGGYRYALSLLTVIYVFNFVDRQIVNIVAEPIKAEFALADWQLGAMTGLSFALLYTLCGIPIARWAEHGHRPRIVGLAVLVWSGFTAACGAAQSFTQLLLARVGVGMGEAGGTPPAHSLIVDLAPADRRASALAIFSIGAPVGQLLGMALGGLVAAQWGWRSVYYLAAAPGLLLGLMALLTLPEPRRAAGVAASGDAPAPFLPTIKALLGNRSFVLIALGTAASAFVAFGMGAFYGSFFLRNHGPQLQQIAAETRLPPLSLIGITLGLTGGLAGLAGSIIGGRIADAWRRSNGAAYVLLPALCMAVATPLLVGAMLASDVRVAIALIGIASLLTFAFTGVIFAAALGLVAPRSRATASAAIIFLLNLVGLGLGPLCLGFVSDLFAVGHGPETGLRIGMCVAATTGWLSAALFWMARTSVEADTIS